MVRKFRIKNTLIYVAEFSYNFCVKIKTFKRKLKTIVDLDLDFSNSLEESTVYGLRFLFDWGL